MKNVFQTAFYTGVGLVVTAKETADKAIKEALNQSKKSEKEGKKTVNQWISKAEDTRNEAETKLKNLWNKALSMVELPSRSELEVLNAKIAELEAKVAGKKSVTRKTATEE